MKNTMLPKFLFADNSQETPDFLYVVHTREPRCIIRCDMEGLQVNQQIYWIDKAPPAAAELENLLREAETFMEKELDSQEDLFDKEFGTTR